MLAVICDRCVFEVDVIRGNVVEVDMIGGRYVPDVDVIVIDVFLRRR